MCYIKRYIGDLVFHHVFCSHEPPGMFLHLSTPEVFISYLEGMSIHKFIEIPASLLWTEGSPMGLGWFSPMPILPRPWKYSQKMYFYPKFLKKCHTLGSLALFFGYINGKYHGTHQISSAPSLGGNVHEPFSLGTLTLSQRNAGDFTVFPRTNFARGILRSNSSFTCFHVLDIYIYIYLFI